MDMEYNEQWDIYSQIGIDTNVERGREGQYHTIILDEYDKLTPLAAIEKFVRDCLKTRKLAYDMQLTSFTYGAEVLPSLALYFSCINEMLDVYDEAYVYSPKVEAFYKACRLVCLLPVGWPFDDDVRCIDPMRNQTYGDSFNALVLAIRQVCQEPWFESRLKEHERDVKDREERVLQWERDLFSGPSRHLIMPFTFAYKPEYRNEITPEQLQKDLSRFLLNRRSNSLLAGIREYVWRKEEGDKVGLHIHFLAAYNGKVNDGINRAKKVCRYWSEIVTDGRGQSSCGIFYSGSAHLGSYDACAGKIDRHQTERRNALIRALIYMAKADQFLKRKSSQHYRSFGMSHP